MSATPDRDDLVITGVGFIRDGVVYYAPASTEPATFVTIHPHDFPSFPPAAAPSGPHPTGVPDMTPTPTPTARRVSVDGIPHGICPACGRTIMVRADGVSLYTHNRARKSQCPMSRARVTLIDEVPA